MKPRATAVYRFLVLVLLAGCQPQPTTDPAGGVRTVHPTDGPSGQMDPGHRPPVVGGTTPPSSDGPLPAASSLAEARKGFQSRLAQQTAGTSPVDEPPSPVFQKIKYESAVGQLAAYLTPDPKDGKKHPAIVWITGGDCNSIGDVWTAQPVKNDQTAAAYRQAGIVMMFPSLRGGNDNPGTKEGFLGEVNDVLAATDVLAKEPYVDPARIYLGGHSTGGTLVLLVGEYSDRFRAVFSFGPVADVAGYGSQSGFLPFDLSNPREIRLRSPGYWLASIRSPVFVFEGTGQGNLSSLQVMARSSENPKVKFFPVQGASHFSTLAPTNRLIAQKILRDEGVGTNLTFTEAEVNKPFEK